MKHLTTFEKMFEELLPEMMSSQDGTMKKISKQQALDRKMFGPVYHGSDPQTQEKISKNGFRIFIGNYGSENIRNGYANYARYGPANEIPPVHHLGFGVYFTQSKESAKRYNNNSTKGLREYYLDVPRLLTINYGSENTMMKWWKSMGYDTELAKKDRVGATKLLTDRLSDEYDAVLYLGKSLRTMLDGNQIVVFDVNRIYEIDNSLAGEMEMGSKVVFVEDVMAHGWSVSGEYTPYVEVPAGSKGTITNKISAEDYNTVRFPWMGDSKFIYEVKLTTGRTCRRVLDNHIAPLPKKRGA